MSNLLIKIENGRIKQEKIELEEDVVQCRLCTKGFASEVALSNHTKMEHFDAYLTGDSSVWTQPINTPPKRKFTKEVLDSAKLYDIKIKTEDLVSSMQPTSLTSLASQDVSYIIIKADNPPVKKTKTDKKREEKLGKVVTPRKEKEAIPITGPFECLQPSSLVADGACHQIFFSCCEYSAHVRDEHTRRRKGLRCQVCEKPLLAQGEHAFSCELCGLGFDSSDDLTQHTNAAHVKLKPYQCSVCNKRFTQMAGVQQHLRMHTGDRPFPCTFCPKAFTQKSGLDQHLRIHTKVRPYRCVVCSKSFCQSVHLKQHMRTHTNVAPFQCGICDKRFKQSSHLNYHLKNHNPGTMTDEQRAKYCELMGVMTTELVELEIPEDEDSVAAVHILPDLP